jgi:hypothetical protein
MIKILPLSIFSMLLLFVTPAFARERWVLFPTEHALSITKHCSIPSPDDIDDTWIVPDKIVTRLERDLPKLSKPTIMLSFDGVNHDEKSIVINPRSYFRQYAGVTVEGRKFIYVNAFKSIISRTDWKTMPIDACDDFDDLWQVLYDPATRKFSQLVNYSNPK